MTSTTKIISALLVALAASAAVLAGCSRHGNADAAASASKTLYTCGMHPQVIQDHPGNCPICGMKLEPVRKAPGASPAAVKYYKSTMIPGETSPVPAKDSMGMDMVPVYENGASAAGSGEIAVDPVTIQNMNIQTTEVERGPLRRVIRTVGTIDYNETALADVTTKFKGWIEKLYVDATGQLVHRGEPLFAVYSPDLYSAEVEYLLALSPGSTNETGVAMLRETAANKLKFYDISEAQIAEDPGDPGAHRRVCDRKERGRGANGGCRDEALPPGGPGHRLGLRADLRAGSALHPARTGGPGPLVVAAGPRIPRARHLRLPECRREDTHRASADGV
jgi:hypothetical protein